MARLTDKQYACIEEILGLHTSVQQAVNIICIAAGLSDEEAVAAAREIVERRCKCYRNITQAFVNQHAKDRAQAALNFWQKHMDDLQHVRGRSV